MSRRVRSAEPAVALPTSVDSPAGLARVLQQLQKSAQEQSRRLKDVPLLDGLELDAEVTTTAAAFPHKLGRKPRGWIVTDKDADARIWRTEAFDAKTLTLRSSATVNVKVWVF